MKYLINLVHLVLFFALIVPTSMVKAASGPEQVRGKTPTKVASEIEDDVMADLDSVQTSHPTLYKLRSRVDFAMNGALYLAFYELRKKGQVALANQIQNDWEKVYEKTMFRTPSMRDIGDHAPLNKFIADSYDKIEFVLGQSFCISSHIADIKSLNFGIPVVFKPCSFPMDKIIDPRKVEYKRHFCGGVPGDDTYNGVMPVVSYWAVYIGCTAATSGLGFMPVCGLVGGVGEKIIQNFVAPAMSDRIFTRACGE